MSIFLGLRNDRGLSDGEIEYCVLAWRILCGEDQRILILDEAGIDYSRTRFIEDTNVVYLGANAYPGEGFSANSRMSDKWRESFDYMVSVEFERVVSQWIKNLSSSNDTSEIPDWARASGLYDAIKNGSVVTAAAV